jgi:hypothetical protein
VGITADGLTGSPPAVGSGARCLNAVREARQPATTVVNGRGAVRAPAAASASDLLPMGAVGAGYLC